MTEPTDPANVPHPDPLDTTAASASAPAAPRPVDERIRCARALLARACGGVPTPTLAGAVAAYGPIATLAALRAEPDTARMFYRAEITAQIEDRAGRDLAAADALPARFLVPEDPDWPVGAAMCWHHGPTPAHSPADPTVEPGARRVQMAPLLGLWVRGAAPLTGGLRVTVSGARAPGDHSRRVAGDWCAELGTRGVRTVCGGALGVETAALQGALTGRGPAPLVVAAAGLDRCHPPANKDLLDRVAAAGGAVVSPYPFGMPFTAARGYGRQPLMVSMGDAVLVVEAVAGAGSAVEHARRQGRRVLVVPSSARQRLDLGSDVQTVRDVGAVLAAVRGALVGSLATSDGRVADSPAGRGRS